MNFEVLKRSHVKRNILIGVAIVFILSAIILTFTKAKYKITKSLPLVNGTINYDLSDLNLIGVYIQEGEEYIQANEIPLSGYKFNGEESYCTANNENIDVTLNYDMETQTISVVPLTKTGTKCYLYFDEASSATDVIEDTYEENQGMLAYDGTVDNNLRYIGANPNNYVYFNCDDYNNPSSSTCELWRIIGIFNENSHGISGEKLVKLIRSNSLGNTEWDSSRDYSWVDPNNNWSTSSVKDMFNGDYLNRTGSYSTSGIKENTQNFIANAEWKLGGSRNHADATPAIYYQRERRTAVPSGNPTTWNGKIALMYASDYGYATSGGTSISREECLNKEIFNWYGTGCYNNDWLYKSSNGEWLLNISDSSSGLAYAIFKTESGGYIQSNSISESYAVTPTLYLSPEISITGGDGSRTNPYTLQN